MQHLTKRTPEESQKLKDEIITMRLMRVPVPEISRICGVSIPYAYKVIQDHVWAAENIRNRMKGAQHV